MTKVLIILSWEFVILKGDINDSSSLFHHFCIDDYTYIEKN